MTVQQPPIVSLIMPEHHGLLIGPPGSGIRIQIDLIRKIVRPERRWDRTTKPVGRIAKLNTHRDRAMYPLEVHIYASNSIPFGAEYGSGYERDHTDRLRARLEAAMAYGGPFRFWNGVAYEETPAGAQVWVLDAITGDELMRGKEETLECVLHFGEQDRADDGGFSSAVPEEQVAEDFNASTERGRQSPTEGTEEQAAEAEELVT